jgi:putative ABC transport system substrate-binding protein
MSFATRGAASHPFARRRLLRVLALFATATAFGSLAQQSGKLWRVGFLALRRPVSLESDQFGGFSQGMRELGYVEGRNLLIEWRFADGKPERLPVLAAELVQSKVDVILAAGTQAISAAQRATTSIPIVMAGANDPVGSGFIASLGHPGGNVTGLSLLLEDVTPKQLEILLIVVPRLSRLAVLANPANVSYSTLQANVEVFARKAAVEIVPVRARTPLDIERAFSTMEQEKVGAVIVVSDALFTQQIRQIATLAEKNRLPLIGPFRQYAEAGAMMSYGENFTDHFRRAAAYVDKILKGAKPGDLPVEQPTRFELIMNLKTARLLGLSIPRELLLRVDEAIDR